MDSACTRNSQAPRSKPQECEDANNLMKANKSCFAHTSLDYVYQVCKVLQCRAVFKYFLAFDCVSSMWSFFFFIPAITAMISNLEGFLNQILSITFLPVLILEKEPVFSILILSARQGHYWYRFYNVTGDWTWDLLHLMPAPIRFRGGGLTNLTFDQCYTDRWS